MFVAFIFKILLVTGLGHVVVTSTDYVACKSRIYGKAYCASALLKYKIQKVRAKKIEKKLKQKDCKWYKKVIGKC